VVDVGMGRLRRPSPDFLARKGVEVRPPDSLMVNVESLHEQEYEVCHEPAERV